MPPLSKILISSPFIFWSFSADTRVEFQFFSYFLYASWLIFLPILIRFHFEKYTLMINTISNDMKISIDHENYEILIFSKDKKIGCIFNLFVENTTWYF